MEDNGTQTTSGKKHYLLLDGLRGVAAIGVVIFHFMEWVFSDFSKNFIAHGFLAVDFFFCLSGFVIAYAYDDRIGKIGLVNFFKSRLIRLHPLVIFGSVLGLMAFVFDPFSAGTEDYSLGRLTLLFLASIFMIPAPLMAERSFNLFGFNAPSWSLFWEYVANVAYALVLVKLNRWFIAAMTIVAACILTVVSYRSGNLLGGWSGGTFWDGGARVFYSFLAGLVIYRFNMIIPNKLGFPVLAALLFLAFLMPWSTWNWLTEAMVVMIYFPLIVSLGAGSLLSSRMEKACQLSGDLSYPLYMTHYCAIWIFGNFITSVKPPMQQVNSIIVSGVFVLILFGYVAMRFYDMPVRTYLKRISR